MKDRQTALQDRKKSWRKDADVILSYAQAARLLKRVTITRWQLLRRRESETPLGFLPKIALVVLLERHLRCMDLADVCERDVLFE